MARYSILEVLKHFDHTRLQTIKEIEGYVYLFSREKHPRPGKALRRNTQVVDNWMCEKHDRTADNGRIMIHFVQQHVAPVSVLYPNGTQETALQ